MGSTAFRQSKEFEAAEEDFLRAADTFYKVLRGAGLRWMSLARRNQQLTGEARADHLEPEARAYSTKFSLSPYEPQVPVSSSSASAQA